MTFEFFPLKFFMKLGVLFFLWGLLGATFTAKAQSCKTGKLDPRVASVLKNLPPERSVEEQRKMPIEQLRNFPGLLFYYPQTDMKRIKVTADSIPVLVFNPSKASGHPVIIYYHGGSFIVPLLPSMEYGIWKEAKTYQAIVFAVDYRVAPEHKFPAGVNDAYNAFKWIIEHAIEFGGDTSRIFLMGYSAGGNLATVVSQKAKKQGIEKKIKLQILNCPVTDVNGDKYPSWRENEKGYVLTRDNGLFALENLATPKDYDNPELSPMLAKDLSGLPPAVIFTAEFDPLRDDGASYADLLKKAGVRVWFKCFPGQIHCLAGLPGNAVEFKEMTDLVMAAIEEVCKRD